MNGIRCFMVFSVTCVTMLLTLFWGACYVTLTINNFTVSVTSWHLAFKCTYKYLGMSMFNSVLRCMPMLHNGLQVEQCVHKWHLALQCSRISSSCILKNKTVISMCHSKCHNVDKYSCKEVTYVDEWNHIGNL